MPQLQCGKKSSPNKSTLLSQNGAAQLLERDRGTLKRALRDVQADALERGQPRYKLSTVLDAMDAHTRSTASRSNASPIKAELAALEQAGIAVEIFLSGLRAERKLERRRAFAKADGNVIGALDQAFEASITAQGSNATAVYTPLRNEVIGAAINELLSLCNWNIAV